MIEAVNGPQFIAAIERKAQALNQQIETAVKKTVYDIDRETKKNTPVRTGNLRRSWQKQREKKWAWLYWNDAENKQGKPYGKFVEYGTRKMAGRYMLTRALHRHIPVMREAVSRAIRKAFSVG